MKQRNLKGPSFGGIMYNTNSGAKLRLQATEVEAGADSEGVEIHEDKDSARKDEIAALGGQTTSGTNVFSAFHDRLNQMIMRTILMVNPVVSH
ncbi:Splicing factor SF3a60-like protein, partial [Cucurbita argyrosperma subsp. sororia]